ncbi:MAG: hypothetical protein AAFN59_09920 [Pseudomonadota bacterium]
MKDTTYQTDATDDIDVIVEALMRNPENVDDIKTLLRQKISAPGKVRVLSADKKGPDADPDEFWDNFPV